MDMAMAEKPEWEYRERCLEKKGEECAECGSTDGILVHHIDGQRDNNDMDNLIPLCEQCHREVHAGLADYAELVEALGKTPREIGDGHTSIRVSDFTWNFLADEKNRGDSFDDVIWRLFHRSMGTTISVSDDTWERLDERKNRGESFDDVVSELLDVDEYHRENGGKA